MQTIKALIKTMRPKQWTKNSIILAALVFDEKLFNPVYFWQTMAGLVLFCLISGVVYTINDLVDMEKDRQHPKKCTRPLPSGQLAPRTALIAVISITITAITLAILLSPQFALILVGYLVLQLAYSLRLKHVVLLDVLAIAAGFVLRVAAGVPLVDAERFSPWLYLCTTFLALFLGLGKRRGELVLLAGDAENHRPILKDYNLALLDQLMNIVTSITILSYALYTFSAPNLPDNHAMMLTIPFVLYGIFRYLYLVQVEGITQAPDEVLLIDRPLQVDIVLWGLTAIGIFYFRM
ncbi:MAG: decaprenyl-phosphate phosphoribosyltransferase [Anaerolineae bacterium]|nr:decaprenyl-phosphate phosphoribosyltransferase [Anaerolineae bacterium]